jgi:signal peptidase II
MIGGGEAHRSRRHRPSGAPARSPVWRAALVAAVIVGVDQATKALVRAHVRMGSEDGVLPGVQLVNSRNKGVAFNLLEGKPGVVTAITALVVIGLLAFFFVNRHKWLLWVPTGLLLGGAAGNVIDRVARDDGVTDFIKLPAWPAFNVADMAITFGVLALFYVLEGPKREA